jgi:hypothetical protein
LDKALAVSSLEIVAQPISLAGAERIDLDAIKDPLAAKVSAANEGLLIS